MRRCEPVGRAFVFLGLLAFVLFLVPPLDGGTLGGVSCGPMLGPRLKVGFTLEQLEELRIQARLRGCSIGAVVRDLVRRGIADLDREAELSVMRYARGEEGSEDP